MTLILRRAAELRRELCARNLEFARTEQLAHVLSYGEDPVVVYVPDVVAQRHGNFLQSSYQAILRRPAWARRLAKIHAQARTALPRTERSWKELDSCTSSDALLMNIFCCPRVCGRSALASLIGVELSEIPEFGYKAHVPLLGHKVDRTEVDMKLGTLFVEAKLTESDFQKGKCSVLERYRDFKTVFDLSSLPRSDDDYISYQLIRNVLAAYASGSSFCVLVDSRRPDLIEAWYGIMRCVRDAELRTRCKVLTWQELSSALPNGLQSFLETKYGIVATRG